MAKMTHHTADFIQHLSIRPPPLLTRLIALPQEAQCVTPASRNMPVQNIEAHPLYSVSIIGSNIP